MICLDTNRPQYASELCEVIRLFYGMTEIVEGRRESGLVLTCRIDGQRAWAKALGLCWEDPDFSGDMAGCHSELLKKKSAKRAMKTALSRLLKELTGMSQPWGALTGIRHTRLAREFEAEGGREYAYRTLVERFDVSKEKADLVMELLKVQAPILKTQTPQDFDVYAGIPFCRTRCLYCSFAAYEVGRGCATAEGVEAYTQALCREIEANVPLALAAGGTLRSLYIGGGTPTALSCEQLRRVAETLTRAAGGAGVEFTVEAGRPDTITEE